MSEGGSGTPAQEPAPAAAPEPAGWFKSSTARTTGRGLWWQTLGELSSVRTAATLIAAVAVVTLLASYYERDYGMEAAHVLLYQAWWFNLLFIFIAVAVVGAVLVRLPLRKPQIGFAIVHLGLLLLIAGFWLSGNQRLDGLLQAWPGEASSVIALPTDELRVVDQGGEAAAAQPGSQSWRSTFQTIEFAGYPTPLRYALKALWPVPETGIHELSRPVTLATLPNGTTVAVRRVVIAGAQEASWAPAPGDPLAQPATRIDLTLRPPAMGGAPSELVPMGGEWLTARSTRSELGPCSVTMLHSASPLLVEDFLAPADEPAKDGRLLAYWQGKRFALTIDPTKLPQQLELAPDLSLHVVRVIPNPAHDEDGPKQDDKAQPNPLLELDVHQGRDDQTKVSTLFVSAYSLRPVVPGLPELMFSHPQLADPVGGGQGAYVQLVAGPDGRLHVRSFTRSSGAGPVATAGADGRWSGTVAGGDGKAMELRLALRHLPAAVQTPEPLAMRPDKLELATRWLELEVRHGGGAASTWIARGTRAVVSVPGWGEVLLGYQQAQYDLQAEAGFAVRLERFTVGKDPGGQGNASFASEVTVLPKDGDPRPALITMNEPLHHGGVTLYQTSYFPETDHDGHQTGRLVSVFTAAQDRGRILKYLGSLILVAGIVTLYLMRPWAKRVAPAD